MAVVLDAPMTLSHHDGGQAESPPIIDRRELTIAMLRTKLFAHAESVRQWAVSSK